MTVMDAEVTSERETPTLTEGLSDVFVTSFYQQKKHSGEEGQIKTLTVSIRCSKQFV